MKFFANHPLTRKIAVVTAVKLFALAALWWLFFSEPPERMTAQQVGDAVLHPAAAQLHEEAK